MKRKKKTQKKKVEKLTGKTTFTAPSLSLWKKKVKSRGGLSR